MWLAGAIAGRESKRDYRSRYFLTFSLSARADARAAFSRSLGPDLPDV
jgi:hypothetical protein